MDGDAWSRVQSIFHELCDRPEAERRERLPALCGGDEGLAAAVVRLLARHTRTPSSFDAGARRLAQQLSDELVFTEAARGAFGPYQITGVLGGGGMGTVYSATRTDNGQVVALKVLTSELVSTRHRERFASEQRALAVLNHPSIARLYDADTLADGTPWFVMEHVDGVPLTEYCEIHRLAVADRLRLVRDVCDAVQHAHQRLIVHRDLKPPNILVTGEGRVKLLDFGIAKRLDGIDVPTDQTQAIMTPGYASPEQISGGAAGTYTDVYALGVILYELLAGHRPFEDTAVGPYDLAARILSQEPRRPSAANRSARAPSASRSEWADLDVLCARALHTDPDRRYQTVDALMRDIDHFLRGEPLEARADSVAYRAGKFLRRHSRVVAAAAVVAVAVTVLVAFYTARLTRARASERAEAARTARLQQFMLALFEGGERDAAPASDLRVLTLVERGVKEASLLENDPAIQAEMYQTLGSIFQRLGSYDRAGALLQSALDARRILLGPEHPEVAETLLNLGLLRIDQAQLDEAERMIREGVRVSAAALPEQHPIVMRATAALGKVLEERGDYDEAIATLERAVRLYSAAAPDGVELAATLTELANAHFYANHFAESEALNRRVLAIDRRVHGNRHPNVADDLLNIGAIQYQRGDYAGSERANREAVAIFESWYGSDHPETGSAMTILAQSLSVQRKLDEAAALLRQALATQERVHGPVHPRVAFVLNEIGGVAQRRREFAEARDAFERAFEIYGSVYSGRHSRVAVAMANLGMSHLELGEPDKAERLVRDAVAMHAALLSPDHVNTAISSVKLGRVLLRLERLAEAEAALLSGYRVLAKQASRSIWMQSAREDLAAVYEALGRVDEAQKFRAELEASPAP